MGASQDIILDVRGLTVWFPVKRGILAHTVGHVKAVDGVSFSIRRGETLGVVGESGCGKSTICRAILGLTKPTSGDILIDGKSRLTRLERARKVQVVFQDPLASLNPRHTVREIVTEGMIYHGLCKRSDARRKGEELLGQVGLPGDMLDRYPHEFSGGQRQRICIARAIALRPELLICDEAVSALDLSIRAQMLDLLGGLKKSLGLSMLFVTHDLGVVKFVADNIVVMNKGRIVERGRCGDVLANPQEEYTRRLVAAVPRIGGAS